MSDRSPKQVGFTAEQRAAVQAVEEQSLLDLTAELIRRLNKEADRIEAFVTSENQEPDPPSGR